MRGDNLRFARTLMPLILAITLSINSCAPDVARNNSVRLPMNLPGIGVTMIEQNPLGLYAFVDVDVLTMETAAILRHQTVIVANQRIVALGPVTQLPVPLLATQIDATGKYLLPGLADMHIHLREEAYQIRGADGPLWDHCCRQAGRPPVAQRESTGRYWPYTGYSGGDGAGDLVTGSSDSSAVA